MYSNKQLQFWLALIVSAVFFGACIRDENPYFESPSDLKLADTRYVDTFSTQLETYRFDSLSSSGRQYLLAGNYNGGQFSPSIFAAGYFQLLPETYPQTCPDSILDEFTKATLTLKIDDSYGQSGTDQFSLHALTSGLPGDRTLFADSPTPSFQSSPLLTTQGGVRTDNLLKVDANELGRKILATWKQANTFSNDQQFLGYWPGFSLRSLDSIKAITRFDLNYSATTPSTMLEISFRVVDNGQVEERKLRFRTNTSTAHFYEVKTDLSNTPYAGLTFNTGLKQDLSNPKAMVQGLAGLAVKVKLPGLLPWKSSLNQRVKIFKAELVIQPDDPGSQSPPPYLSLSCRTDYQNYRFDDFNTLIFNEENVLSLLASGYSTRAAAQAQSASRLFSYQSTSNVYTCNITSHIQAIVDGTRNSDHINVSSSGWLIAANRMPLSLGAVKLKIYYYPI